MPPTHPLSLFPQPLYLFDSKGGDRYRIFTVGINTAGVTGVRVTPQLFTTTAELDALVRAITELARG